MTLLYVSVVARHFSISTLITTQVKNNCQSLLQENQNIQKLCCFNVECRNYDNFDMSSCQDV